MRSSDWGIFAGLLFLLQMREAVVANLISFLGKEQGKESHFAKRLQEIIDQELVSSVCCLCGGLSFKVSTLILFIF
jgi:hypothetical protein